MIYILHLRCYELLLNPSKASVLHLLFLVSALLGFASFSLGKSFGFYLKLVWTETKGALELCSKSKSPLLCIPYISLCINKINKEEGKDQFKKSIKVKKILCLLSFVSRKLSILSYRVGVAELCSWWDSNDTFRREDRASQATPHALWSWRWIGNCSECGINFHVV